MLLTTKSECCSLPEPLLIGLYLVMFAPYKPTLTKAISLRANFVICFASAPLEIVELVSLQTGHAIFIPVDLMLDTPSENDQSQAPHGLVQSGTPWCSG